jgi:hypothetical protein
VYGFTHLRGETTEEGLNARAQVDLLHRSIAKFIELQTKAEAILLRALNQCAPLQHHKRSMRSTFVQLHALAYLCQTERRVTLAENFEHGDSAIQAMQLIRSVSLGNRLRKACYR